MCCFFIRGQVAQAARRLATGWTHSDSPSFPPLHLRHSSFSNPSVALPTSQLIVQPFRCFTHVTTHSPTLPSLYLRHSWFSNLSVALPTSQLILQPYFRFSYVTGFSLTSPGEPSMSTLPNTQWWLRFYSRAGLNINLHFSFLFTSNIMKIYIWTLQLNRIKVCHSDSDKHCLHKMVNRSFINMWTICKKKITRNKM